MMSFIPNLVVPNMRPLIEIGNASSHFPLCFKRVWCVCVRKTDMPVYLCNIRV